MKKCFIITWICIASFIQNGCATPKPSELKMALAGCMRGGKECFEKRLGSPTTTGWTKSGYYYMRWYGSGTSQSADPYETKYGRGGGLLPIPCTLEINLKGDEVVGWLLTGECKDYELRP